MYAGRTVQRAPLQYSTVGYQMFRFTFSKCHLHSYTKDVYPLHGEGNSDGQHKHIHCGIDEKNSILLNYYVNTLACN